MGNTGSRAHPSNSANEGLPKRDSPVLRQGFGMIFSGSLTSLMAAGGQTGRFPRKDQILAAGENLFQASAARLGS